MRTQLDQLRQEAKQLMKAIKASDTDAIRWFKKTWHGDEPPSLCRVQHVLARENGFTTWQQLVQEQGGGVSY